MKVQAEELDVLKREMRDMKKYLNTMDTRTR
jgi:hypothetical protein